MPKIKKFAPKLTTNLTNIQTFIVDEVYDSQYFKITEFKNTFTGGKNGFLIEGSPFLKETTEVKLEILDANGNPVYYEIAKGNPQYYESTSILVAVYIYNDTPVGPAKITILGEAKTYNDNGVVRNIPDEWDGVYNVKWEREFKINRNLPNIDRVRFKYRPEIAVSELSGSVYLTQITEIVQEGFVNGYPITPEVGTVLANKYYGDILYKLIKTGSGINKVPAIDKPFWESNNQFDIIPQFDYYLLEKCNRDIGDDNVYYLSNPETVFGNLQNPIIPYNQSLNLKIADDTGPDYYTLVNVMKLSQYDESLLSPVVSTGPVASIDITSPTYPFVYGCDGTLQPGFLPSPTLLNTNQIIGTTTTPTQTVLSVVISVYTQIENDGGNDILRAYATIVPSVPQEVVITTSVSYSSPLGGIADYGFTITVPPSTVLANSDGYDTGLTNVTIQSSCLNGHDFIENANVTVINPCSGYIPQPFIPIPNPSPESTEAEDLSDGGLFPGQSILGAKITIPSASIYDEPIFQFLNDTELVIQKPYLVNGSVNEFNTFDYSLTFNTITNFNTSSLGSSYGNFRINNLNTYVGDVSRVKIYYKPTRDIVQYELLNDVKIESTELLKEEFSGSFVEYGNFTSSYIDYWVTSSNTNYEVSTSNDTVFAGISIESISPTTESFKLQTSESFSFFKDEEYTFFTNIKYSGTLGDDVYFKVYLSGSSFYSGSEQDILILNPLPKNKNQQRLEKNVIIRETGDYHLIIETFGDRWDFGGVSFKSAQDNYFSPDYVDFNIPIPRQRPEEYFDFKFEFYDVNNNYIPTDLFVNKILFKEGKSVIPINSDDLAGIVEDLVDDVNELQNVVTNKPIYKYGEILFGTGTTIISQSADLYWDIPNRRLGVGRKDPQYNVDVIGSVRITDDLIVEGRITAQEYYTEYVSSSIIFESGSTKFGNSNDDTHIFTGSLSLLGDESIDGFLYVNDLPMYQQQLNDMFTGVVSGGIITINPLNGQVFDISEGSGYIVNNYTDPINPTYQYVTWGNLSVSASAFPSFGSNATTPRTNIAINSDGTVHQQTAKFTPQDYREKIVLGRIAHGNTNVINRTLSLPLTTYNRGFHWFDLANSIGPLNVNGNVYSAGSTNLTIQKSAGQTYRVGSNYKNDTTFPDITTDISSNPTEFRYRYRNGSGLFIEEPLSTQITGSRYDNGSGTLQTVNNNQWTVQRIFFFGATRTTIIQFGQNVYNNRIDAELSAFSEQFETDPNLLDDSILRAYLLIRGGATNLSNLNDGEFLEAAVGGGSGGGSVTIPTTTYTGINPIVVTSSVDINGDISVTISHTESGVTPGTYNSLTVDVYGHITSGSVEITGHTIQDSGSDMPQQENLNFIRMIVEDDATNNATIVKRPPSVIVSGSAPTKDLMVGDEWINNETWKKYVRYDEYWVETGKVDCSTLLVTVSGSSSATTYEELTTLQLSSSLVNATLVEGTNYLITDFRTIHRILNTTTINTGPIEPMFTVAITSGSLSQDAKSLLYPQDEIRVDWTSRYAEDGTTVRAGNITYRRDTLRNVSAYYDYRHVKWRRWVFPGFDWETGFVATTAVDITLTLVWSANLPASLTAYNKWEIKFPSGITHNAGAINLTITKGATSHTKQLVRKTTLQSDWTANELRSKVGPIIYSPQLDKFILMDGFNVGESQIGFAISRIGTTHTVGNGLRIAPNSGSYFDVETFYYALPTSTVNNVELGPGCVNNVFYASNIYNFTMGGYSTGNTFVGNIASSHFGGESDNNIIHGGISWTTIQDEFESNIVWSSFNYADIEGYSINNTIIPSPYNFHAPNTYIWNSTLFCNAWGVSFEGNSVESSFIGFGGSSRGDILFEKEIASSIFGWIPTADNVSIRRRLNSEYIHTLPSGSDTIERLNLRYLSNASGSITPLGWDSKGDIVSYTSADLITTELYYENINPSAITSTSYVSLTGSLSGTNSFTGSVSASYEGELLIKSVDDSSSTYDLRFNLFNQNIDTNITLGSGNQVWLSFVKFKVIFQNNQFLLVGNHSTLLEDSNFEYVKNINHSTTVYSATGSAKPIDILVKSNSGATIYPISLIIKKIY